MNDDRPVTSTDGDTPSEATAKQTRTDEIQGVFVAPAGDCRAGQPPSVAAAHGISGSHQHPVPMNKQRDDNADFDDVLNSYEPGPTTAASWVIFFASGVWVCLSPIYL